MKIILESLFFAIPIYIANSFATISLTLPYIKRWNTPIDLGKSWKKKRIFGDGKTFRGLFFGTFFAVLSGIIQYFLSRKYNFDYLDYEEKYFSFFIISSLLLGFGALLGDMIKSFFKRRVGIKRGRPWPPFDQLDFLTGGILLYSLLCIPNLKIVLILYTITPIGHLISNIVAYKLKLKNVWW